MPNSAAFRAKTTCGERFDYRNSMLHQATVTYEGDVRLQSGEYLHAVDFIPGAPFYEPSSREQAIVLATLASLNKVDECWLEVYGDVLPGHRALRADKIAQLKPKDLKVIQHDVSWLLGKPISLSILSRALIRAGMQMPRSH